MSDSREKAWSKIGKLGAVIGVVIGFFTIYNFLRPNEPMLVSDCRSADFPAGVIYGRLKTELDERITASLPSPVERKLLEHPMASKMSWSDRLALAQTIAWPDTARMLTVELTPDRVVVDCTLLNRGRRQATETVLKLPFEIGGVERDQIMALAIGKTLQLGAIKPGESTRLRIWSKSYASPPSRANSLLLTSAEGSGRVRVATEYFGLPASIASVFAMFLDTPVFSSIMLVLLAVSLAGLVASLRRAVFDRGYNAGYIARAREAERTTTPGGDAAQLVVEGVEPP